MFLLRLGRRLPYILLTLLAGMCFVICLFLPRGVNTSQLPVIIFSMLGSFCVSITFTLLWIWTSELMPTTVRNAGVGACSFVARIGGGCIITVFHNTLGEGGGMELDYISLFTFQILATTLGVLADVSPLLPPARAKKMRHFALQSIT